MALAAGFTWKPNPPAPGAATTFENTSVSSSGKVEATNPDGTPVDQGTVNSATWQWGDGTANTVVNGAAAMDPVQHTFAAVGSYNVVLTVTNTLGNTASTTQTVTVSQNRPPVADFLFVTLKLRQYTFRNLSYDPDGTIASSTWNFGDGSAAVTSTGTQDVQHTYAADGNYLVTLTVRDNVGAVASITKLVSTGVLSKPVASFTFTTNGQYAEFTDTSSPGPNAITRREWNFGDGSPSFVQTAEPYISPSHNYNASGTYNVTLTITDSVGQASSVTRAVAIAAGVRFSWTFGDGTTGVGPEPKKTYATPGTYRACMTVTDACGQSATVCKDVVVRAAGAGYAAHGFLPCSAKSNGRAWGTPEIAIYNRREKRTVTRVLVQDRLGTWHNLTNLNGLNWIRSVRFGDSSEQPVANATLEIFRQPETLPAQIVDGTPLAASALPIDIGLLFEVQTATVPFASEALESDFRCVFRGRSDDIAWEKNPIPIPLRDLGGRLMDHQIRHETVYPKIAPAGTGIPMHDMLQEIANDAGPQAVGVFVRDAAEMQFNVTSQSTQGPGGRLEAMRALALHTGGADLKYRWWSDGSLRLTYYKPPRNKTLVDLSFQPWHLRGEPQRLNVGLTHVRNIADVWYHNKAQNKQVPIGLIVNQASISRFGERAMTFKFGPDSPIDTVEEARALGEAAVSDVSFPLADVEVEVDYLWAVETGWLVELPADPNNRYFPKAMKFGVISWESTLESGRWSTKLTLRANKVIGRKTDWLKLATGGGIDTKEKEMKQLRERVRIVRADGTPIPGAHLEVQAPTTSPTGGFNLEPNLTVIL